MSQDTTDEFESITALHDAYEELNQVSEELDRIGEQEVERAVEAYNQAHRILDRYADDATGTGDFGSYVQFRGQYSTFVEGLPEWLPRRDVFEDSLDIVDKRRLNEGDFTRARERLDGIVDLVELLENRDEAKEEYHEARLDAIDRIEEIEEEIVEVERTLELGEADLDAPIERLREPIEQYNKGVREAFREYRSETSAREFLEFIERTKQFPLVPLPRPPEELLEYVRNSPDGIESVPTLLEYAEYSHSKLVHYADDADALKRKIATQRTYLDRLEAEPLTLAWPPEEARTVRWRVDELRRVVGRFASESTIAALREVQRLTREEAEFERLRNAAIAVHELDERTREQLASGEIKRELQQLRTEKETLQERLDALPET